MHSKQHGSTLTSAHICPVRTHSLLQNIAPQLNDDIKSMHCQARDPIYTVVTVTIVKLIIIRQSTVLCRHAVCRAGVRILVWQAGLHCNHGGDHLGSLLANHFAHLCKPQDAHQVSCVSSLLPFLTRSFSAVKCPLLTSPDLPQGRTACSSSFSAFSSAIRLDAATPAYSQSVCVCRLAYVSSMPSVRCYVTVTLITEAI